MWSHSLNRQTAWGESEPYSHTVREFVASGGNHLGFCLGAFQTGRNPGCGLLPASNNSIRKLERPAAAASENKNEVIKIDWDFPTRRKPGASGKKRCISFPDCDTYQTSFPLAHDSGTTVIGTYSDGGNVAVMINSFGDGFVANIGAHPEVDMAGVSRDISTNRVGNLTRLVVDDEEDETSGVEEIRHDIPYDFIQSMLDEVDYYGEDRRLSEMKKH